MEFPFGLSIKDAIFRIDDRFARASHRVDGILVNKYEPKFLSHTLRLLDEGKQLIRDRSIAFPFVGPIKKDIMGIKTGEYSLEKVIELINNAKDELAQYEENNDLPDKPDYELIKKNYALLVKITYGLPL